MVWGSQPSIDAEHHQVFIGTGDLHSITNEAMACRNSTPKGTIVIDDFSIIDPCLPHDVYQETLLALNLDTEKLGYPSWGHRRLDGRLRRRHATVPAMPTASRS